MIITDLTDTTMVIQKQPIDTRIDFLEIQKHHSADTIKVYHGLGKGYLYEILVASEVLFSEEFLVCYFKKPIPSDYKVGTIVGLKAGSDWYYDALTINN